MMHLLELPNELLTFIIQDTLPEGFESFLLTCKAVLVIGESFISRYNQLRKTYQHFKYLPPPYRWVETPGTFVSSIQLLREIIHEPIIARYIQNADFKYEQILDNCDPKLVEILCEDSDINAGLSRLLNESPYLRAAGENPAKWLDAILSGQGLRYATTFLLTLLPNVRKLATPANWKHLEAGSSPESPETPNIWRVLDVIVKRANDDVTGSASLAKLKSLNPMCIKGYDNRHEMQNVTPFLAIESIREFNGASLIAVDDGHTGYPFDPRYESFGTRLEHIELMGCLFDVKEFTKFIINMSRLRTFKFSYETKWHGCGYDCNAGAIIAALMAATGKTLEVLSLFELACDGTIFTGVTDMTGFKNLKELELDTTWLSGPPYHQFIGVDGYKIGSIGSEVPRLADLLPPSIMRLKVMSPGHDQAMASQQSLFADFASDRATRLPNLTSVRICPYYFGNAYSWSCPEALTSLQHSGDVQLLPTSTHWQSDYEDAFFKRFGLETR